MSDHLHDFVEFHGFVSLARNVLAQMPKGGLVCAPTVFDGLMADYGLAPEDIGATAEQIESAKRQWGVARAMRGLRAMAAGEPTFGPMHFNRLMADCGLAPEDIGATADEVAAA